MGSNTESLRGGGNLVVLNHVAFGTRAPSDASRALERLGFAVSPSSSCEWELRGERYSASALCCVFPNEYLDFICMEDSRWEAHLASSSVYGGGFAPTGIVLSGIPPAVASAQVPLKPYPIVRRLDTEPPSEISYDFLPLGDLGLPLGLIHDSSPETLRRACPTGHPNTASGISRVHLRVPSIADAQNALAGQPFSLPRSSTVPLGTPQLHLHLQPSDPYLSSVLELLPGVDRPLLLALEFSVSSLEAAADVLRAREVAFRTGAQTLTVDPDQGFGTGIIFSGPLARRGPAGDD